MAVDVTVQGQNWKALVKIEDLSIDGTPSQTLRIAEEDTGLSDGTLWLKRILYISPLDQQLGRIFESQFVLPDLTLVLADADSWIRQILDDNDGLAGKDITVYYGYGKTAANYEIKFVGQIPVSGGAEWDDQKVTLSAQNTLDIDSITLPKNKMYTSTYANVENKSKNKPIPEVLGDFQTTAGNGEKLPCFCVDTMGPQFTPAQYMTSIETVQKNGAALDPADYTVDQLSSPCLFTLNVAYDPETDTITCNGVGRHATGGHDTCIEWCEDLLGESWGMGLASAKIDSAAFLAVQAWTSHGDVARRWIGKEVSTTTLLGQLSNEGFFELFVNAAGEYEPVFRYAEIPGSETTIREADLVPKKGGGREFKVKLDPQQAYANQFPYNFALKPARWESWGLDDSDSWGSEDEINDTAEQTAKGQIVRRRLKFYWLYTVSGSDDRANREKLAFSGGPIEMPVITVGLVGLALNITSRVSMFYSKYEILPTLGTPMMVRTYQPDYQGLRADLLLWNLDNLSPKRYQADGSPAWSGASTYAQEVMGFYEANSEQVYF